MVGDHSRQMKTQICTVGDVGDGFRSLPILLNCWAPVSLSQIKMASLENTSDSYLESLAKEAKKNDVAFMDIIKEFPVIYNRACADFKDRNIKNNAWRKISELLNLEESKCKQRYESIRTTFSRYVRKALGKSGAGRDDIQLDPKYEHLRWLATFIKTRPTSGNVQLVREAEEQSNSDKGESEEEEDKFPSQETSPSSEQRDSAEPDGKKPSQKKLKKTLPKKRSWSPAVSAPDPNLELCKVMHSFQKSLDASYKAQTPLKTDNNSDTHYCLSLAERMSGLDNKTKAYVRHSIEKLFFDIESGAYATVVPATQYHATPYFNGGQFHPGQPSPSFS